MTLYTKQAGTWVKVQKLYRKQGGSWVPVKKAFRKISGTWTQYFAAEIVAYVTANQTNFNIQNLFTAQDWADDMPKRVIINSGVTIGSTVTSTAALLTGSGFGNQLIIDNAGDIQGAGGQRNTGAGGPAINVQSAGVTINNTGAIRGGGGGGGIGGTGGVGGTGYYVVTSGQQYTGSGGQNYQATNATYAWVSYPGSPSSRTLRWAGSTVYFGTQGGDGTVGVGSYTYIRGDIKSSFLVGTNQNGANYAIIQQYLQYVGGAGGGAGGAGGLGQGYGQANSVGLGGAGGGNNGGNSGVGGTGGTGGTGGGWGTNGNAGATGNTGASGNYTAGGGGYAGGAGGQAGKAIMGTARTLNNSGTIQGSTT